MRLSRMRDDLSRRDAGIHLDQAQDLLGMNGEPVRAAVASSANLRPRPRQTRLSLEVRKRPQMPGEPNVQNASGHRS